MRRLRRHLNYANVAATLALIAAVAGGTTAIAGSSKAPKNSVTSKSIRDGNVTARDLSTIVTRTAELRVTDQTPNDDSYGTGTATATCPAGARVISGSVVGGGTGAVAVNSSAATSNGWTGVVSSDVGGTLTGSVTVRCLIRKPGSPQG